MPIIYPHFRTATFGFLSLFILGFLSQLASGQDEQKIDFIKQVQPIFEQHCLSCHGEEEPEGFRIDLTDEAMDYIEAESADDSEIYLALVSDDEDELMPPPDENNPLTADEIKTVAAWIDQGATWPASVTMKLPVVEEVADNGSETQPTEVDSIDKPAGDGAEGQVDDKAAPAIDPKTKRMHNAVGSLHPAAVHMPIGLLVAAGLFALLSLRGNFVMSDCAYYCLWLGTLGSIAACVTGYYFSPMENQGTIETWSDWTNQNHDVFWHRTSGVILTVLAFIVGLFAASSRNQDPDDGTIWKLLVIGLAAGIGWIGHEGGALTHGKHHYNDLKAIGADWLPGVFGDGAILGEPAKPAGADAGNPHAPKANGDGENAEDTPDNNAEPDADANSENEADESKVGQTSDET